MKEGYVIKAFKQSILKNVDISAIITFLKLYASWYG